LQNFFQRNRYGLLLAALLLTIIVAPVMLDYFELRIVWDIALSLVVISAVYSVTAKRKTLIIGLILAALSLIGIWSSFILPKFAIQLAHNLIDITFISYITYHMFTSTFRSKVINRNVIYGAIAVYLLIGFFWTYLYSLLHILHPGSLTSTGKAVLGSYQGYMYFSFVTLTTLGYGDIIPLTSLARSLVILEALVGQVYLIVNVSWLVGLYVAHTRDQRRG
jgi:voltage-gated potassium channel